MIYLALATVGFIVNWILLRRRVLEYAVVASLIYLVSFVFVQSFDILYVEYAIFFVIPHIKDFRRIPALYFGFIVYIFAELVIGIFYGSPISVFAVFLTRFFPLVFIALINKDGEIATRWNNEYEQKLLRLIVVCELILSVVLVFKGNRGDIFVVSHQPVGANLSLVGVLLAMDISLKNGRERERHRLENILYLLIFVAFAMISGIRGYIIIILPCAFYSIISYVFGESKRKIGLIFTVALLIGILSVSYVTSGRLATIIANIDTSVGYREIENQFFYQTFKDASPFRWIFGYGVGARGERIGSGVLIYALARGSAYYTNHLSNGAVLLNFWLTVIKDMGIVGLVIYITMYCKIIPRRTPETKDRRIGWILYAILYAFMLFYRTSCTNGLIELYAFTLIMNNQIFMVGGVQLRALILLLSVLFILNKYWRLRRFSADYRPARLPKGGIA